MQPMNQIKLMVHTLLSRPVQFFKLHHTIARAFPVLRLPSVEDRSQAFLPPERRRTHSLPIRPRKRGPGTRKDLSYRVLATAIHPYAITTCSPRSERNCEPGPALTAEFDFTIDLTPDERPAEIPVDPKRST